MKKLVALLFFSTAAIPVFSNMSSPIREGSLISTALSSRNIDILHENLLIILNSDMITAKYKVDYHIKCDTSGIQVPLLFYAMEYQGGFKVWVDGKEIKTTEYVDPGKMNIVGNFNSSFITGSDNSLEVEQDWGNTFGWLSSQSSIVKKPAKDLRYFETNLEKGEHTIHVEYDGLAWENLSGWVKKYSFRYSLYPARNWRSFGGITINLDATQVKDSIVSNLGVPHSGNRNGIMVWNYDSLPANYIVFEYQPEMNSTAAMLVKIGPNGITIIAGILLSMFHLILMYAYRKKHPNKKFSRTMILGSFLVPFVTLVIFMFSFDWIFSAIGPSATKRQGYMSFLIFIFYPGILIAYWLLMWIVDRIICKIIRKNSNQ